MSDKAVLQSEAAECGLACIATISAHYGMHIGLPELRRRFPISLKGAKLSQLMTVARALEFNVRAVRVELHELSLLRIPAILHWDTNHFVVLEKVSSTSATILDPASGKHTIADHELSSRFTGVALELEPGVKFVKRERSESISLTQLTGSVHGLWRSLAVILALSVSLQFFVVLAPFYMQWVVDHVLVAADRSLLSVLALGFGFALLMQLSIGWLRGLSVVHMSSQLGVQWLGNVMTHLIRLPMEYFEKRNLGDITSRVSSLQAIQRTLTTSFVEAFVDGLMAVVTLAMMMLYSWKLALLTIAAVALYTLVRLVAYGPFRAGTEKQLVLSAKQQTHLLETLRGMQSLKVACEEDNRLSTYRNYLIDTVNQDVRLSRMALGFTTLSSTIFGVERIAVIWLGASLALDSIFSVGMLIAYLSYKDQFAGRSSALIDKWMEMKMLRLHGERLSDILLSEPEELGPPIHDLPDTFRARIVVDRVSFRYADGEPWVLEDCSFTVEAGESVAIVGESGGGKTTLVKLLLGLLTPTSGSIKIGDYELSRMGERNVRSLVGAVMQEDQLFAGNIASNISFFDQDPDQSLIENVAKLSAIHDDIMRMPMEYQTLIGDMGNALSGGQKQRIILARALYRSPKFLVLDEATSHLDIDKERMVDRAVGDLSLTRVIVAHRPEAIRSVDRVLVMQHGRIIERPSTSNAEPISTDGQLAGC